MKQPDHQYELLDFGEGQKLERFGDVVLCRPSPVAEGARKSRADMWAGAAASFQGQRAGDGVWSPVPSRWAQAEWSFGHCGKEGGLLFRLRLEALPSGQVGVFPEQRENWNWIARHIGRLLAAAAPPLRVLNLF